jgi:alpha-mannosidase
MEEFRAPLTQLMCFYGVGNHGGPTIQNIESIRRLNASPDFPTLLFSTPDRYFAAVAPCAGALPVVHEDLQHHASGCYSAHSGIKRWNRRAENLLLAAEKFAAVAERATGQPYPCDLRRAWAGVLFNQFHDILAGTSLEAAYDDARDLYGEASAIAGRALNNAIQSLSWNITIPPEEGMTPVVVFNPNAWASRVDVELEFGPLREGAALLDDAGRRVPLQTVTPWATVHAGRTRLGFVADLPPLGYRVYRVVKLAEASPAPASDAGAPALMWGDAPEEPTAWLENDRFRLEIARETGHIARLYDKRAGVEVFRGEAARPVVIDDPSDTWAHGVWRFDDVIGAFVATRVPRDEALPVVETNLIEWDE